jgi:hypothetical protein
MTRRTFTILWQLLSSTARKLGVCTSSAVYGPEVRAAASPYVSERGLEVHRGEDDALIVSQLFYDNNSFNINQF